MAMVRVSTWLVVLSWATVAFGQLPATAPLPARELLNSERIEAAFGSYGVEVLEQNAAVRISNLFTGAGGDKVCRTFAIVRHAPKLDAALAREHAAILAGGSIGAVFAAQGWEVRKTHLRYGERPASAKLAALMRVPEGTPLAEHAYVLDVVKDGRAFDYAALVEIHHPDYLRRGDLVAIYGPADGAQRRDLLAALDATADERAR